MAPQQLGVALHHQLGGGGALQVEPPGLTHGSGELGIVGQTGDERRQANRITIGKGCATAGGLDVLPQVGLLAADHRHRRGRRQMAVQLAGGHLTLGGGQQRHHRQISSCQHGRQDRLLLIRQKAHLA